MEQQVEIKTNIFSLKQNIYSKICHNFTALKNWNVTNIYILLHKSFILHV